MNVDTDTDNELLPTPANDPSSSDRADMDLAARGHQGSLRSKVVLSLAAMFAGFLIIDEVVRQRVIQPAFSNLEQVGAIRDADRVKAAIDVELDHLQDIAEQRAVRFDTSELFPDVSPLSYVDQSVVEQSSVWPFEGVQWAAVVGTNRTWYWLHHGPGVGRVDQQFSIESNLFPKVSAHVQSSEDPTLSGLTASPNRIIHAYAAAIVPSLSPTEEDSGQPRYYLVVGKAFDENIVAELRKRTQVDFSIQVYRSPRASQEISVWEADSSTLVAEAPLATHNEEIVANLFVQVPREVMQQARNTTSVARRVFACGVVAALLMMMLQLNRIVVVPVTAIREHTEQIAQHGLDSRTLSIASNDEIGQLAQAFDRMKNRLADTQNRLADASHAAGMSQVADTVIHNVGNVLTNVNSLIDTATDRIDGLRIQPLEKLADRLRASDDDEALQEATPDYLQGLAVALKNDQAELGDLLSTLHDNVRHIHDVIRDQRRHTMKKIDRQRFSVTDTVTEAIRCCQARLDQDRIAVTFTQVDGVDVNTDRSLLLQIVINVISNARHAIREHDNPTPTLAVSILRTDQTVQIHFRDTGCGMDSKTLSRIFDAHYTTRKSGSGLGLHFCALALKRLGGKITAESDGIGAGSTFVIELPMADTTKTVNALASSNMNITTAAEMTT